MDCCWVRGIGWGGNKVVFCLQHWNKAFLQTMAYKGNANALKKEVYVIQNIKQNYICYFIRQLVILITLHFSYNNFTLQSIWYKQFMPNVSRIKWILNRLPVKIELFVGPHVCKHITIKRSPVWSRYSSSTTIFNNLTSLFVRPS